MHILARKPKGAQQTVAKPAIAGRAPFGHRHEANALLLHRAAGNDAVQRLPEANAGSGAGEPTTTAGVGFDFSRIPVHAAAPGRLQTKLALGPPGDVYEQEADRVAEQVMRMPEPPARSDAPAAPSEHATTPVARVQTKSLQAGDTGGIAAPPIVHEVLNSPGQTLDGATRAFMEPRFGRDFSGVRVHTDAKATEAAREIGAKAFTVGDHMAFDQAEHAPHTQGGKLLLAHELAHAVQQRVQLGHVQRKDKKPTAPEITQEELDAACVWAETSGLGEEAIRALQSKLGTAVTGVYDEAIVKAVFAKQREWQKTGTIPKAGQATPVVFRHLGLISTKTIASAAVTDAKLTQVKTLFPDGITVAVCPQFKSTVHDYKEFLAQAAKFATSQHAVGLSGDAVAVGVPVYIKDPGDVITAVQSIHRGLLQKHKEASPADGAGKTESEPVPAFTKVKNLAIFSHGENYGIGLNESNKFTGGGLHTNDTSDNPANVVAFVRGIADAVVSDVRVELYACNTGADAKRTSFEEWITHSQGDRAGSASFAAKLAGQLGPDATVLGHTTTGHTTENFAARVFGKEAGAGAGGIHVFELIYDDAYIKSELICLFPEKTDDERAQLYPSLREQMWAHYKDSVDGEFKRSPKDKRYAVPIGREMLINPANAKMLVHSDWSNNWIPSRLKDVNAPSTK